MNNAAVRLEFDKILERIASKASFSLGKERVLKSEPSFSMLIVNRDLKRIEEAMVLLYQHGPLSFGGVADVSSHLSRASKSATLAVEEIVAVGHFMQGSNKLRKQYQGLEGSYPSLDDLFDSIVTEEKVLKRIQTSFGENDEVLDNASSELKSIRKEMQITKQRIDQRTQEFLSKHREILVENVVTLHLGRQTFLLKPGDKNKLDGNILGTSASGQSVYFEPAFLSSLQNEYQSLVHQEITEIERICREVSLLIGGIAPQLIANLDTCALIDEIMAKAYWGFQNEGVVAKVTKDRMVIKNARHPLIDPKEVVSNDYSLVPPYRMILISGPNTGGKSVTLKTMGLFVMMTLAGCPVLADEAEIMMVDQIFVDIGDQQSIERSLSSFSAHLETISHVTEKATENSLILLDELGSQTDPLEGEALSMAILDYFRDLGCWVVATTHFSRLKKYGTQYDDILIASVEFDMKDLKPTYRYKENVLGESNALSIAKRLGIDKDIIASAEDYKKQSTFEEDNLLEILAEKIQENEKMNDNLKRMEKEFEEKVQNQNSLFAQEMSKIKQEKELWIETKDLEFEERLETLENKIRELNASSKPTERHQVLKEVEALKPNTIVEPIHVGDMVKINRSSQVGKVEQIEKDIAFVAVGSLALQVKLKDLTKVSSAKTQKKKKRIQTHKVDRKPSISLECNVIGMRVADALPEVDKYLDQCILQRVHSCRIVHGVGSGVLREAIHKRLRQNKNIESFALASLNEGGAGATRVVFKQ